MKRVVVFALATAVLALAVGGVSLASQAPANNSNPLVIKLLSRATSSTTSSTPGQRAQVQATSTSGPIGSCLLTRPRTRSARPTAAAF